MLNKRIVDASIDELNAELERTQWAIATSAWETQWTKDMRLHKRRIESELRERNSKEIVVKCSLCGDEWHTLGKVGELEGCTDCDDVFEIQPEDVVLVFDDFTTDEYGTHVAICKGHAELRETSGGAIGTCGVEGCTEDAETYYTIEEEEQ